MLPLCLPARAQDAKPVDGAKLIEAVKASLQPVARGRASDENRERFESAVQNLVANAAAVTAQEHLELAFTLFRSQQATECLALCEAGIAAHENPRGLHDFAAMSHLVLAEDVVTATAVRDHAAAAVRAFSAGREAKATTMHNRLYMNRALMLNCEFDRALAEFDAAMETDEVAKRMPANPRTTRGMMLLCGGKYADAAKELTHESLTDEEREHFATMRIRALALSGDTEGAEAEARARWEKKGRTWDLALLADVLSVAGKRRDALALLRKNPIREEDVPESEFEELSQSRAAFEYLIDLGDKRPKDLRQRLAEHLGHHFEVMNSDTSTAGMKGSPLGIGYVARQAPTSLKDWGTALMFLVCAVDRANHEPSQLERAIFGSLDDPGLEPALADPARAKQILGGTLMMCDEGGVMTTMRLAERL